MSAAERQPSPYERAPEAARGWWRGLQPVLDGKPNPDGNRAALARLRRAGTLAEAMAEEAVHELYRDLGYGRNGAARWLPWVAVVARVLAHVREDAAPGPGGRRPSAARAVGRLTIDDKESALMKPLRFRTLLACREEEELARELRRLVALAGGPLDVGDLARSILYWNDQTRARWAFDYYAAAADAPAEPA